MAEKMDGKTMNITEENLNKLKDLFPEVFEEGKINFDKLQVVLGENIDKSNEKYEFSWNGKFEAMKLAQLQSTGTLIPCKEKSKDWDTTQNLYIEGDNLEVLKLLQKSYVNQIKMIYIDPPYNTGNDFVYKDNFADNIANYKEITGQATKSNAETAGRYHTNWLNMMYPRLKLARNLLKPDGVIFISIDDHEFANLKKICDEIFGENNFIANFVWKSKSGGANDVSAVATDSENILAYSKDSSMLKMFVDPNAEVTTSYNLVDENGKRYGLDRLDKQSLGYHATLDFPIEGPDGKIYTVEHKNPNNKVARWRWGQDTVKERYNELVFKWPYVYTKNYEKEGATPRNLLVDDRFGRSRTGKTELASLFDNISYFDFPKPTKLLKFLTQISTDTNDIILDFFSGSATTSDAIMQLNAEDNKNRKFILVQLPELMQETSKAFADGYVNICEFAIERIRRAGQKSLSLNPTLNNSLDTGFKVFKLDTSNLVKWNNTPTEDVEELKKRLQQNLFYIVDGRSNMDLVYEIMLKYGLPLTLPINEKKYGDYKAYEIASDTYKVMICLDRNLPIEIIEQMTDESVGTYVFADHCFGDANILINTEEILKKKSKNLRIF